MTLERVSGGRSRNPSSRLQSIDCGSFPEGEIHPEGVGAGKRYNGAYCSDGGILEGLDWNGRGFGGKPNTRV